MCPCEEQPRRRTRDLVVSLIRHHLITIDLSIYRSTSPLLDLQHPPKSYTHTMSCLLSFTEPGARADRDDSLDHLIDKSCFQALVSTTKVSDQPNPLLSFAIGLPPFDTMGLSNNQAGTQALGSEGTQEGMPAEAENCSIPGPPLTNFHAFGNLPPELRIKIWHLSFLPRVVELHPTWPNHDAAGGDDSRQQEQQHQWQSGCSNPAALSVCSEAREIALKHFRIAYSLASPFSGTSFIDEPTFRRRTLYISPEYDTVALLGPFNCIKLSNLLDSFRDADLKGKGISNLALSTAGQGSDESVTSNFDTTILKDLEQLILFTYGELLPPPKWSAGSAGIDEQLQESARKMGNKCDLVPCKSNAWYLYKQWMRGEGRLFWDDQKRILRVGKNRIRIQDLEFSKGW